MNPYKIGASIFLALALLTSTIVLSQMIEKNEPQKSFASDMNITPPLSEEPITNETSVAESTVSTISATPIPKKRDIKIGVVVEDYANKQGTIPSLEKQINTTIATVSIFKQFGNGNNRLIQSDLSYIKSSGKRLMVAWEPWDPAKGMSQDKDYLSEIINGNMDSYIIDFAKDIKAYGSPVTLRFGHEMNGDWYPWGNRPAEYKNAYKRIYELFKNQGVTNVTWMWSVNAEPLGSIPSYYPGDAYVDSIGIDGFNFGTSQKNTTWRSFTEIFKEPYNLLSSKYKKPIIISETASSEHGGNKALWITDMKVSLQEQFVGVSEIVWFNLLKETDWRIESTDKSLSAFQL